MRITSALAATGLLTTTLLLGSTAEATPAAPLRQTAGGCSVAIPSRIAISTPYSAIRVNLVASNCAAAGVAYASWHAYHPSGGLQEILIFDNATSQSWGLYDFAELGRWTWSPGHAWDAKYGDITQNTSYTDVRMASRSAVSATRSGATVTLNVSAARYAHTIDNFVPWGGAAGQLQYRVPGTTQWIALKSVTTTAAGEYSYRYTSAAVREYRVYFPATSLIWETGSSPVRA
jgi:hypothetical protein